MKATRIFHDKTVLADGAIVEMVLWQVATPVQGSKHTFKYRLFYGNAGQRIVGYDNERGKGDHRHLGATESDYSFVSPERLVADFLADVAKARGEP